MCWPLGRKCRLGRLSPCDIDHRRTRLEQFQATDAAEALRILAASLSAVLYWRPVLRHQHVIAQDLETGERKPPKFPVELLLPLMIAAIFGLWLVAGPLASTLLASLFIVAIIQWNLRSVVFFFWTERDFVSSSDGLPVDQQDAAIAGRLAPSVALSIARYAVCVIGVAAALLAVGVPISEVENSQNTATRFVVHLFGVTGLALVTHIAWVAVRVPIDQRLRSLARAIRMGDPTPMRAS